MSKSVFIAVFFATKVFGNTHLPDLWCGIAAGKTKMAMNLNDDNRRMFSAGMVMPAAPAEKTDTVPNTPVTGKKKNDNFSKLMAGVVNDTAILYDTYVETEAATDTVNIAAVKKPVNKTDPAVAALTVKKPQKDTAQHKAVAVQVPQKKKPEIQNPVQKATVEKIGELKNDSSLQMAYVTQSASGKKDTIFLTISFEPNATVAAAVVDTPVKKPVLPTVKNEPAKEERKDTMQAVTKQPSQTNSVATIIPPVVDSVKHGIVAEKKIEEKTATAPAAATTVNSNCRNSASDYDVDKLRVKMLAIDNDDDKLLIARKLFRIKCFTTKQIKALSEVFPTDEGRYKLFDTAYPFASDYANYPQLADLLTSPYFINRFKAMLRP